MLFRATREGTCWIPPGYQPCSSGPADSFCGGIVVLYMSYTAMETGRWTGPTDILKWNNDRIRAKNASVSGYEWEQCLAVRLDESVPAKDTVRFSEQARKNSLNVKCCCWIAVFSCHSGMEVRVRKVFSVAAGNSHVILNSWLAHRPQPKTPIELLRMLFFLVELSQDSGTALSLLSEWEIVIILGSLHGTNIQAVLTHGKNEYIRYNPLYVKNIFCFQMRAYPL